MSAGYVYVGRCLTTNKVYVGSTKQGKKRPLSHIRNLNKGCHDNDYLQKAWDRYGQDDFVWYIVEECSLDKLQDREQWWVGFLRATDERYGFNLCYPKQEVAQIASRLSECQVESWKDPIVREKRLSGLKVLHKNEEWKSRRRLAMQKRWQDPEWRAKMMKVLEKNSEVLTDRNRNEPGFNEHRMRGLNKSDTGRV